ncbi:Putative zinc-finger [Marinospirillum celere]|uniref:Putative zinc-finger n=1 Tax=Marinospirillum celere TaxID=1122252 RepID=A0A1I1E147_9GAMM|nr:zf-HC2 domain-containing protein [Marinospirillum celere]SFB78573.1 Putative zinc-finger [Marinospirillum celere]
MLTCKQATQLMSASQDRSLTRKEHWSLKMHEMLCKGCRNCHQQLNLLHQLGPEWQKRLQGDEEKGAS